jgi:hypothetical protein
MEKVKIKKIPEKIYCKDCKYLIIKKYLETHQKNKQHLRFVEKNKWIKIFLT